MSTYVDEKLSPGESAAHGPARATLAQLKARWGHVQVVEGPETNPDKVLHVGMGQRLSVWRKESGRGERAMFVLEREE